MIEAKRDGDNVVITLDPKIAHVLIWGGSLDAVKIVDYAVHQALIHVEDNEFTDDDYQRLQLDRFEYEALTQRVKTLCRERGWSR